jgi:DNA-binding NarL/FixJ family response regulator
VRVRAQLAAYGGRAYTAPSPSPLEALTPQEQQIARFVSSSATNRDVAARLFLSPSTIAYHLHNIYLKLGVGSRSELAALLGEAGTPEQVAIAQPMG